MNEDWREHLRKIAKLGGQAKHKKYGTKAYSLMGKKNKGKKKKKKS